MWVIAQSRRENGWSGITDMVADSRKGKRVTRIAALARSFSPNAKTFAASSRTWPSASSWRRRTNTGGKRVGCFNPVCVK
jgi:hypothetical protein